MTQNVDGNAALYLYNSPSESSIGKESLLQTLVGFSLL